MRLRRSAGHWSGWTRRHSQEEVFSAAIFFFFWKTKEDRWVLDMALLIVVPCFITFFSNIFFVKLKLYKVGTFIKKDAIYILGRTHKLITDRSIETVPDRDLLYPASRKIAYRRFNYGQ